MRAFVIIAIAATFLFTSACITKWLRLSAGLESRPLAIQTLNLFNQRLSLSGASKGAGSGTKSWRGDWIFRRERLYIVDSALRTLKPDVLLMQEALNREGSPSEADDKILQAGSLAGYEFDKQISRSHLDTGEEESLGLAISLPLRFLPSAQLPKKRFWTIGKDGGLMLSIIQSDEQLVSVFNVLMPSASEADFLWYTFIRDRIVEHFKETKLCPKRLIVAGHLPFGEGPLNPEQFLNKLMLKDPVSEKCIATSACDTASTANEIFSATLNGEEPQRAERILVNVDTVVYDSNRRFDESAPASKYVIGNFGLKSLPASRTYGWHISARLPKCRDDEVWED